MSSPTKKKIMLAARALMLKQGYSATTVDEICEVAGLTKGSFYHFFKTKEEMGLATVEDYYLEGSERLLHGPFEDIKDPVERAYAFLDHTEALSRELWADGCLLGNMVVEMTEDNPNIRAKVAELFDDVIRAFAENLRPLASKDDGQSAMELAEHLLSIIEGTIIVGRAYGDWERVGKGIRRFKQSLILVSA